MAARLTVNVACGITRVVLPPATKNRDGSIPDLFGGNQVPSFDRQQPFASSGRASLPQRRAGLLADFGDDLGHCRLDLGIG